MPSRPNTTDRSSAALPFDPAVAVVGRIATVVPLAPIQQTYSYRIPDELADGASPGAQTGAALGSHTGATPGSPAVVPGARVMVPLGPKDRPTPAFCIETSVGPWSTTVKAVLEVIDERPLLSPPLLELGKWIARYYACPLGRTLNLMVPAAAKRGAGRKTVRYVRLIDASMTPGCDSVNPPIASETPSPTITQAPSEGPAPQAASRKSQAARLTVPQARALDALRAAGGRAPLAALAKSAGVGVAVISALVRTGRAEMETQREDDDELAVDRIALDEPTIDLNDDQRRAVAALEAAVAADAFSAQVLFGVTGSGKTECYVRAIRATLARGRQAIMLVPEIALTTQTVQRLRSRFARVAVIHSGLTDARRARIWRAVAAGGADLVIGTRSAVFAPLPRLGLIIVDEEHEGGYKNQSSPRYHSRDVAVARAHLEGIPVVLGSATPSLETWHNLERKKHYRLIRLPHRVGGLPMPTVQLVDMRMEHRERRGVHLLSRALEDHLGRCLQRGEQAVLLLNRRGYASFLHCPRCATAVVCPHCSVHMVLHQTTGQAHCHYCHARLNIPERCPMAGCDGTLVRFGIGTQRVEEELKRKFPAARAKRIDSDSMQSPDQFGEVFGAFERREYDVLVGTQMIAKGLDFPFVSFVGVVSADTALSIGDADFRAEERTFQLVLQVAGRSGRGTAPGHVVVQTFAADSAAVRHAVLGDYEAFAAHELDQRRKVRLPPVTRMIRIVLSDPRLTRLRAAADTLATRLKEAFMRAGIDAAVLDAAAAAIPRIRDAYRYDILLNFPTSRDQLAALDLFRAEPVLKCPARSLIVDVDPVSMQ